MATPRNKAGERDGDHQERTYQRDPDPEAVKQEASAIVIANVLAHRRASTVASLIANRPARTHPASEFCIAQIHICRSCSQGETDAGLDAAIIGE